ncbi:19473_t:CDS:2, partial [Gigaspora rosea]
ILILCRCWYYVVVVASCDFCGFVCVMSLLMSFCHCSVLDS